MRSSPDESHLRLIILDYPRIQLDNPLAYSVFSDMLRCRQTNFLQTSDSYLVIDKHDMIGTHLLVYDFKDPFARKMVAGFRITYEDRAHKHGLSMPIESALACCPPEARREYGNFCEEKGPAIQFNTLFIDPPYTYSKSSLELSNMLFFGVCAYIRRLGFNHYVGATNDQLKTDRWMKRAGIYTRPTFSFAHPDVGAPHTLFFIDQLNDEWLKESFEKYEHYWAKAHEIIPPAVRLQSFADVRAEVLNNVIPLKRAS